MNQMKTLLRLSAAVVLGGLPLAAQTTSSSLTTITTSVPGMTFSVDGTVYRTSAAFVWPTGSKHILDIPAGDDLVVNPGTKSVFTGWTTTSGTFSTSSQTVTITADPSITGYIAQFATSSRSNSVTAASRRRRSPLRAGSPAIRRRPRA